MAKARKFRIEKAHVDPIAKTDPALATTLPAVGYVVHPVEDGTKMEFYPVDGAQVGLLTKVEAASEAPQAGKKVVLIIGTDFDKAKSDIAYTTALRKKGKNNHEILNAHFSTKVHHEAIHARIIIDGERARASKIRWADLSDITKEYIFYFTFYSRSGEGRALRKAIAQAVDQVGAGAELSEAEVEKFLNEKFTFDRVSSLTPDYDVQSADIVAAYTLHFENTLRRTRGFLRLGTNNLFLRQFNGNLETVKKTVAALYAKIDDDRVAAAP
jgi:hypothetical protein